MAQITDAGLRATIAERLGAVHVEVTDMSGTLGPPSRAGLTAVRRHR